VPLLAQRGAAVTTKEMAEAAGVAEGTLFAVFDDKRALVTAAIQQRMDAEPLRAELAGVPPQLPLDEKLLVAAAVILPRIEEVKALASALHGMPAGATKPVGHHPQYQAAWNSAIIDSLTRLLAPHAPQLRVPPVRVARFFASLLFASRTPLAHGDDQLAPTDLVDVILHGVEIGITEDAA
jgi:AcrR family transcriptional regulator